jgi:1-acyl-sn-glycerol-3-phosphate acyltransferase
MLRTVFVWSCIVIATLAIGILTVLTYLIDRKGKLGHRCGRLWGKVALLANGVKVSVQGLEHLRKEGPYVFMANHQGSYDIFALLAHLPYQFKWLAKKELFSVPFLGWAMSAAGYVSIDREGTRETVAAMNEAAQKIHDGMSVVIFPEGSRSPDGSIQPFKKGGFTLAVKSRVPIVPVAITGSRQILAKGRMTVLPGEIRIQIGSPIETEPYALKDRGFLMDKVKEAISKNVERISKKEKERG